MLACVLGMIMMIPVPTVRSLLEGETFMVACFLRLIQIVRMIRSLLEGKTCVLACVLGVIMLIAIKIIRSLLEENTFMCECFLGMMLMTQ